MATTQTYTSLTEQQKKFYNRTLLERLLPNLVYTQYGQSKPMPKHEGDTVNFRRFDSLEPATTALTEGVTPAGNTIKISKVEATVKQYGDFIEISDKLDMVGIDPVLTETTEVLGEQAGLTIDTIARDIVLEGTNVMYAGGKSGKSELTASDVLKGEDVMKAVRNLRRQNVKPMQGGFYIGIIDADVAADLMQNDKLWQDVSTYNGGVAVMKGELGKMHGVRFVSTGNAKITEDGSGSAKVHRTLIIGQGAYGVIDVNGSRKPQVIVKPHGSAGTADPLNQRATTGWKALFTAVRLNELAMIRIESGATE